MHCSSDTSKRLKCVKNFVICDLLSVYDIMAHYFIDLCRRCRAECNLVKVFYPVYVLDFKPLVSHLFSLFISLNILHACISLYSEFYRHINNSCISSIRCHCNTAFDSMQSHFDRVHSSCCTNGDFMKYKENFSCVFTFS